MKSSVQSEQTNKKMTGKQIALRILATLPAIGMMILIFRFSMDTGEQSAGLSERIGIWIVGLFNQLFHQGMDATAIADLADKLQFVIRKTAHITEFALLTGTYILAARVTIRLDSNHSAWVSALCTFLYACSDELHQRFVSDRSGQFTDVLIDSIGAVIAVGLYWLIHYLAQRRRK